MRGFFYALKRFLQKMQKKLFDSAVFAVRVQRQPITLASWKPK
jgi:hypothetical protein